MQTLWPSSTPSPSGQTAFTLPHTMYLLEECKHEWGTRQRSFITNQGLCTQTAGTGSSSLQPCVSYQPQSSSRTVIFSRMKMEKSVSSTITFDELLFVSLCVSPHDFTESVRQAYSSIGKHRALKGHWSFFFWACQHDGQNSNRLKIISYLHTTPR